MTSIKNYQQPYAYLLFAIAVVLNWSSCEGVNEMSGGNSEPGYNTGEILRVCYDGWEENPETKVCECLPPKVIIGQYECREIEADDWYSSMDGCLVDQGISFQIKVPVHPDSVTSLSNEHFFVEVPDTITSRKLVHRGVLRFLPRGEKFDSIQMYLPSTVRPPYYKWPTVTDDGYNTGFHGIILNDSTLVGQFVFGPMYDSWGLDRRRIFSECEAIIRKGRVE